MNGEKDTHKLNPNVRTYTLEKYQMLRFEVSSPSSLVLVSGTAEIYGTELVCSSELLLNAGVRGTVVTFHGCKIVVNGPDITTFLMNVAEDQEIAHVYMNIHASLEVLRQKAVKEQSRGPRVLVCGHESVGKSTLCRTLASYAARRKHKPILVDVNVGLNQVCLPTTIAAVAVSKPYDLMEGWGLEEDPLVFCFGHVNPASNLNLFREQVNRLAELVNIRSENDTKIFTSGCIINMNGFRKDDSDGGTSKEKGIQAIRATAAAFEVDTILVIEDGFLETFLREDLPPEVTIARLPKSSGVVTRSADQWTRQRDARVCAYLHGENPFRRLHPHQITLKTSEYSIYKVGSEAIPDALLPHGAKEDEETWRNPVLVPIGRDLKNHLLAVSQASDPQHVPDAPVYGFVVIVNVADDKSSFTVLSPCPYAPPNNLFLLTTICYVDPELI
ncbi:hypothetical protein CRM22_000157 [Opisthorchis felineus]|uniref:Protein CLP1 homolog n=1 Tax=Opisthorchis felineus TaxID=147828 RepID=A0A4S2MGB4_OPIFE|nr:hypothetical protein CRM22_000157 [Opisthorchis felineus]